MPSSLGSGHRKLWEESNPVVAGVLAYLIPGAGHFYQGRTFKGTIYFVCILGTFFGGMRLGEGAVVYHVPNNNWGISLNYLAQVCVGLPALPAWLQTRRAKDPSNTKLFELSAPLSAPFTGSLITTNRGADPTIGQLEGTIELATLRDGPLPDTRGVFRGRLDGADVELPLLGGFQLDRPISAGFQRNLSVNVSRQPDQHPNESRVIRGSIPRSFFNAYAAPPDADKMQDLHGRLGKFYDLAVAFTMIAGLLNVLAIWDAVEGPAYGFGDETPSEESTETSTPTASEQPATSQATPTSETTPVTS